MWLILSLLNALGGGVQNAYFKKKSVRINPILMAWSVLAVSSLLFSPMLLLGVPHLTQAFWIAVAVRLVLDSLGFTLYIKAIQLSPLSLVAPMVSVWTLGILVTQYFINHISPSPLGLIGVFIIVCGVYYLNFDHDTKHILSPFRSILKERGVLLMVIVCIIWSVVTAVQKLAIDATNPYFYTAFFQLLWAVCFAPIAFFADTKGFKNLFTLKMIRKLTPAGIIDAMQVFPQFLAYSIASPAYVNAVGNTNILFSSFFGWLFFKEKVKSHIVPTIIIVLGVILVSLAQK